MIKVEEVEEIKEVKVLTMNELFNELKEKISEYEELSRSSESVEVDNSEIFKIEEEIKNLKTKIDELNSSIEGKSKIEKMKITLNVTSIESEITLKEMDLEEQKQKAQKEYGQKVKSSKKDLENVKDNLNTFIKDTEDNLENAVKSIAKKKDLNNLKLATLQEQGLNKLGLTVSDLSGITLTKLELDALRRISSYTKEELRKLNTPETNTIYQGIGGIVGGAIAGIINNTLVDNIKINLIRLINIKNNKIAREQAGQKLIEGTDLEETKNYFENIMKTELLNLKNIEEESKKLNENKEVVTLEKEQEKLEIKREAIQNKINTINEMVDEMIKEVIKEELKKREIVIPSFVPVTKYFNAPDEVEE